MSFDHPRTIGSLRRGALTLPRSALTLPTRRALVPAARKDAILRARIRQGRKAVLAALLRGRRAA